MTVTVKYQGKTYVYKANAPKDMTAKELGAKLSSALVTGDIAGFSKELVDGGILVLGKEAANRAVYILND